MPKMKCPCGCVIVYRAEKTGAVTRCPRCATVVRLPGLRSQIVRQTGKPPAPAHPEARAVEAEGPESRPLGGKSYWPFVSEAFSYPLQENSLAVWLAGTVFLTLARLLVKIPFAGWIAAAVLYIPLTGYLFGYQLRLIWYSRRGAPQAPDWPDVTNYVDNACQPFLYLLALSAISFSPYLAYRLTTGEQGFLLAQFALLAGGMFYFGMGQLCVAVAGLPGLSPLAVLRAIASAPLEYMVAWLAAAVLAAFQGVAGTLVDEYFPVPVLGTFLVTAVSLYVLFVVGRLLGLIYFSARERFRWLVP